MQADLWPLSSLRAFIYIYLRARRVKTVCPFRKKNPCLSRRYIGIYKSSSTRSVHRRARRVEVLRGRFIVIGPRDPPRCRQEEKFKRPREDYRLFLSASADSTRVDDGVGKTGWSPQGSNASSVHMAVYMCVCVLPWRRRDGEEYGGIK